MGNFSIGAFFYIDPLLLAIKYQMDNTKVQKCSKVHSTLSFGVKKNFWREYQKCKIISNMHILLSR